jgi:hypothetical protein
MSAGPLNISLNTAEAKTSVPLFAPGYVKLRLAKLSQDEVPDKGSVIKLEYDLVDPAPNTDGGTILPGQMGSKFFESIQLYDKNTKFGDPAPKWAVEKISKRIDALLNTGDAGNSKGKDPRPNLSPELIPLLIGQVMIAKMNVRTGDYVGNEIAQALNPSEVPGA